MFVLVLVVTLFFIVVVVVVTIFIVVVLVLRYSPRFLMFSVFDFVFGAPAAYFLWRARRAARASA